MGTSEDYYYRILSYSIIIIIMMMSSLKYYRHSMRVRQMANSFSMFNHVKLKKSQLSISTCEITSLEFNSMDELPRFVES